MSIQKAEGPLKQSRESWDYTDSLYRNAGAEEPYYHGWIWCRSKPYIEGRITTPTGRVRCSMYMKAVGQSEYRGPFVTDDFFGSSIKRIQPEDFSIGWWDWKINLTWIESGSLFFRINW